MPEWIVPWMLAALAIWPLQRATRWIHKHLQGLGLLMTNDAQGAVLVYYVALFPGVVLREISQWIVARSLLVKVKKFRMWPEKQRRGAIRLGLVEIDDMTDTVRATLVGIVPVAIGIVAISIIGVFLFNAEALLQSLATGDMPQIMAGLDAFMSSPDFWLWIYVIFAIANAMLPEEHDHVNWWLLAGSLAAITIFLLFLDLGVLVQAGLEGPFTQLARMTSLALILALLIDWLVIGLIRLMEWGFGRFLNREVEYR